METTLLIEKIVKETGKSREEIDRMIDGRKKATHGLLSDYGAIYAVSREFGISLNEDEKISVSRLSDISALKSFNVAARVKMVYPPKEFERKDGSKGKFASLVILDESGNGRIVLWDNHAEIAKRVGQGDIIMVRNVYCKNGVNGSLELHAGSLSNITINPKLDIKFPEIKENLFKIDQLNGNISSVDLICRVTSYRPATEFSRGDGSIGLRASFIGEDETGSIRVVLWNDSSKIKLSNGDFVRIENAYTREGLNNTIELQLGSRSRISITERKLDLKPLSENNKPIKINEIKPDILGFGVIGRILHLYPQKAYSKGNMASFILGDESGTIRTVLWDEKSEIAKELKKGDAVRIRNAYSRASISDEPEVHIGKYSEILVNQDLNLPSVAEIEKLMIKSKGIINLENNDRYVRINGRIVSLDEDRKITYMTCPNCNKKVQNMASEWFCEFCNKTVTPVSNIVLSFLIEDDTGSIRAISFKENAEKILGMDTEEVMNLIGESGDESLPLRQVKERVINKEISFLGRVSYSNFSDQLEFIVDKVLE